MIRRRNLCWNQDPVVEVCSSHFLVAVLSYGSISECPTGSMNAGKALVAFHGAIRSEGTTRSDLVVALVLAAWNSPILPAALFLAGGVAG